MMPECAVSLVPLRLPGDLAGVGQCMSDYWQLKKKMAPGCEPELVTRIMQAMEPHVLGMSLAGAGGGGFMYLLTKKPHSVDLVRNILTAVKVCTMYYCYYYYIRLTAFFPAQPG